MLYETGEMKEKLHRFIETAEEKRVKAIFTLLEKEIAEEEWEYTGEFKAEPDRRYDRYINGGKMVSSEDAHKQTKTLLQKIKG